MGFMKIGMSLMQRTSAWVKACRKTSSLHTKSINPTQIQGLRYSPTLAYDTVQLPQSIGKHKIPRYLYHMTSVENYHKILESGCIKPSGRRLPDGVYMLELDSFSKYWSKNMRDDLCNMISANGEGQNIVILKIPTKNLTPSKIKIRTQEQVEGQLSAKVDEWFCFSKMPPERKQLVQELISKYGKKEALIRYLDITPAELDPVTKGIDAKLTPLYKQRKADIEFVYGETIPVSNVEIVGQFNYEKEFGKSYCSDHYKKDVCKTVFERVFRGKTEEPFLKAWRD